MWIETYYIEDKIHTLTIIASYRSLPNVSVQSLSHVRIFATPWTAAPDAGRYWGQEKKGTTEDEMAGWHH